MTIRSIAALLTALALGAIAPSAAEEAPK